MTITTEDVAALVEKAQFGKLMYEVPSDQILEVERARRALKDAVFDMAVLVAAQPTQIKVQVVVQGGLVVNVGANVPLEVEVIDLDNKDCAFEASSDFDENGVVEDDTWCGCSVEAFPVTEAGMLYQVRDREAEGAHGTFVVDIETHRDRPVVARLGEGKA